MFEIKKPHFPRTEYLRVYSAILLLNDVKRSGLQAEHSLQSSAVVKNWWSLNFSSPVMPSRRGQEQIATT